MVDWNELDPEGPGEHDLHLMQDEKPCEACRAMMHIDAAYCQACGHWQQESPKRHGAWVAWLMLLLILAILLVYVL